MPDYNHVWNMIGFTKEYFEVNELVTWWHCFDGTVDEP